MTELPNRTSIRLNGYDYAGSGGYFVTICVNRRLCLFGEVVSGAGAGGRTGPPLRMGSGGTDPVEMRLSSAGEMVAGWLNKMPKKFPGIDLDASVIMPNHVHFIVINTTGVAKGSHAGAVGADPCVCPNDTDAGGHMGPPLHVGGGKSGGHMGPPLHVDDDKPGGHMVELGSIVQWFKTMSTNEYIRGVKNSGWTRFDGRLWQRNYWERIIRDREWDDLRSYIRNNPVNWMADELNPHKSP